HVAGIIAARDNNIGTVGVAPEATIIAVKVLDRRGSGSWSGVIAGLNWAIANDVDVVNMSLSGPYNQDVATAITLADQAGIVIVAAAGNSGGAIQYPAAFAETIAVSATDQNDNIAYFSSRGNNLSLAAPGVNIRSTFKNDGYKTYSGTSMAAPHVAGAAALMLSQPVGTYDLDSDSTWDTNEARAKLQDRAEDVGAIGFDNLFGYGLVDADNLILP
ncbi:MAG: S8 family serine peptidase, partial [Actinomycetia bacterium]|nr:S8 family serine peptidase [Actinomycetes bacterium]